MTVFASDLDGPSSDVALYLVIDPTASQYFQVCKLLCVALPPPSRSLTTKMSEIVKCAGILQITNKYLMVNNAM